ncbi:2TM domain-containing protein [Pedococcus cremeus]|uniref:2TM domain-containing protein n=2 Tax=Pedococcus cremeus TaxID=587636 RepID=A0A1H9VVY6_9MICO|nr:2TM domain-containing protein [Pedococcus cremeus]
MSTMTDYQLPPQASPLTPDEEQELRARATKRLKAKRDLKAHILAYVLINLAFVGIWYLAGGGFFWPIFIIFGWGIGIAFNIYDVVSPEPGPDEVHAEMERLRQRR